MNILTQILLYVAVVVAGLCGGVLVSVAYYVQTSGAALRELSRASVTPFLAQRSVKDLLILLAGELLAVGCVAVFGFTAQALSAFVFLLLLLAVAAVDAAMMEIPNGFVLAIAAVAVADALLRPTPALLDRAIGIAAASVPLLLVALLVQGAFGGGDIKLMAACGAFLGWANTLIATFAGILIGGAYGVYLLVSHKKEKTDHFAFGPCLCVGMACCVFWGDKMIDLFLYVFDFSSFF